MAPHSSTLAWKILWTEEPGRMQSMGSLRVEHNWATSLSLSHMKISFLWLNLFYIISTFGMLAKSLQSCPTLCDPIDNSPPGSPIPGILQTRTLEWVAISFSNAWKWKVKVKSLSRVRLLETPWTAAFQAPPSMGFSRQEYWSGAPLPSPLECLNALKIQKQGIPWCSSG